MDDFARRLLAWFDDHGRHDLPWQRDATPYHVWLSEIMLQQTQVATVIPYYERFIAAFGDVRRLADAAEDEVLHLWSGLGYYARARNLHRTARIIVADYDGAFPADLDALQSLPGIGRSTAGAILSSALGGRAPILDGNVKRVLARFHAVEGWPGKSTVAAELWRLAELHTPKERVADYTQAIMDLGATLCSRSKPDCIRCPQQGDCTAFQLQRQTEFPGKKPKKTLPTRGTTFAIACTPALELLLERRPGSGIWGGLWCFPEFADAEQARHYCEHQLAADILEISPLPLLRHSFSHYHLEISPLLITLSQAPRVIRESDDLRYWSARELPQVGLAAPVKRLWQQVTAILSTESTQRTGAQT
jgi:A/G-specific adenine glycosylase